MEKAHEIALRTLRKTSRKAQLEFFKIKSEHVMRVFKQEQMFMVEEYYLLKKRDAKKEKLNYKSSRIIQQQERVILEMTTFIHDCLDQIFEKALSK